MLSIAIRLGAVLLLLGGAPLVRAAEPGPDGMSAAELKYFLTALQAAIRLGDPTQVARFMYFPLLVNSDKGVTHSYGGVAFARKYDQIFTPALRSLVLAQDPAQLTRNARGAMAADGRVWIANVSLDRKGTKRKICVTTIDHGDSAHPPPAPAVHPPH